MCGNGIRKTLGVKKVLWRTENNIPSHRKNEGPPISSGNAAFDVYFMKRLNQIDQAHVQLHEEAQDFAVFREHMQRKRELAEFMAFKNTAQDDVS
jgi:hypothetical protein